MGVDIIVNDVVPPMPNHQPSILHNDVLACDIGSEYHPLTLICLYISSGGNFQNEVPLLTLMRALFILVGKLKAGHVDWGTFSCNAIPSPRLSVLDVILTKDDFEVYDIK